MADKFEGNSFLQLMCEALRDKKCFRILLETLGNVTELSFIERIKEYCENLLEKLAEFQVKECEGTEGPLYVQNKSSIAVRDEVLRRLSLLWDMFSSTEFKQCHCSSFFKFLKIVCKEDKVMDVLLKCLKCDDHFIAFQSYKVLCEICKCFPNLLLCVHFQELINLSLSSNGIAVGERWLPVYTAEIIKDVFLHLQSYSKILNFHVEKCEDNENNCYCTVDEKSSMQICTKDIMDVLWHHWLKLTSHFLLRLSTILNGEALLAADNQESILTTCQLILTTMLSCGKAFVQSCDCLLANPTFPEVSKCAEVSKGDEYTVDNAKCTTIVNPNTPQLETSENFKRARIYGDGKWSVPSSSLYLKTDSKSDFIKMSDKPTCTLDCKEKLLGKVVGQLIEIETKKCLLHFSRTVLQFLNDVVDVISEHCFGHEKTNPSQNTALRRSMGICCLLVKNSTVLFGNIAQISGKVHFGGQNCSIKQETTDVSGQLYDEVSIRKVLLLVIKSMLVIFVEAKDAAQTVPWNDLKEALDSWLSFVTQTLQPKTQSPAYWLIKLFSEQDDELVHFLFVLLQIYQQMFCVKSLHEVPSWAVDHRGFLNPHRFFLEFLSSVNYDHSLLLDYLISNETHFLQYFFNYLRYLANDWLGFVEAVCQREIWSNEELVDVHDEGDDGDFSFSGSNDSDGGDIGADSVGSDGDLSDEGGGGGNVAHNDCFSCDCSGGDVGYNGAGKMANGDDDSDGDGDGDDDDGYGNMGASDGSDGHDDGDGGINVDYYSGISADGHSCDSDDGDGAIDGFRDHSHNDQTKWNVSGLGAAGQKIDDDYDAGTNPRTHHVSSSKSLSGMNHLQQPLSCMIRLRFAIERMVSKSLFPYPVTALLKVMKYIETLYERE